MDRASTKLYDLEYRDEAAVIRLRGDLVQFEVAEALDAELQRLMTEGAKSVVLDLARTRCVTNVGLKIILLSRSRFSKRGGRFVLCSLNDDIKEVLRVMCLSPLLDIEESLQDALKVCAAERVTGKAPTGTG